MRSSRYFEMAAEEGLLMTDSIPERRTVDLGRICASYLEAGGGNGPTIMLVHDGAYGSDAELTWGRLMPLLSDDHHVIAPDLIGFGRSEKAYFIGQSPFDQEINFLAWLCEKLALSNVHFVGASFGGGVITRAAATDGYGGWPIASGMSMTGTGGPYRVDEVFAQILDYDPSVDEARRLMSYLVIDADSPIHSADIEVRYENSLTPGHIEWLTVPRPKRVTGQAAPSDELERGLADSTVPFMFVEGEQDRLLQPGWAAAMGSLMPNGESLVMPGGHMIHLDYPAETAELVRSWVGRIDSTSTG